MFTIICNFFNKIIKLFKSVNKPNNKKDLFSIKRNNELKYVESGEIFHDSNFINAIENIYDQILFNYRTYYSKKYKFPVYTDTDSNNNKIATFDDGYEIWKVLNKLFGKLFVNFKDVKLEYTPKNRLLLHINVKTSHIFYDETILKDDIFIIDKQYILFINNDVSNDVMKKIINYGTIIVDANVNMKNLCLDNQGVIIVKYKFSVNKILNNGFIMNTHNGELKLNDIINYGIIYTSNVLDSKYIKNTSMIINLQSMITTILFDNMKHGKVLNYGIFEVNELKCYKKNSIKLYDYGSIIYIKKNYN